MGTGGLVFVHRGAYVGAAVPFLAVTLGIISCAGRTGHYHVRFIFNGAVRHRKISWNKVIDSVPAWPGTPLIMETFVCR